MLRTACTLLALAIPGSAAAQDVTSSFERVASLLRAGENVHVTDSAGKTISGRLEQVANGALHMRVTQPGKGSTPGASRDVVIPEGDITIVRKEIKDPNWEGAAFGAAAGLGAGLMMMFTSGGCDCGLGGMMVMMVLPAVGGGAAVGALLDAVTPGRTAVYVSPRASFARATISPVLSKSGGGVRLSVKF